MKSRRRRLVVLVVAAVAAAGSALAVHKWCLRERPWFLAVGKEIELNTVFGLPPVIKEWAPLELMDDPRSAAFIRLATERVRPHIGEDGKVFWVWLIPFAGQLGNPRGWPMISCKAQTDVWIEYNDKPPTGLYLTEDGSPPIRFVGLFGNWLFYFLPSLLLAWTGNLLLRWLAKKLRRPRRGFPSRSRTAASVSSPLQNAVPPVQRCSDRNPPIGPGANATSHPNQPIPLY